MKRFRFPLEKVRRLRAHGERMARRQLAEELSALGTLEAGMARLQSSLGACQEEDGVAKAGDLARALESGLRATMVRVELAIATAGERVVAAREFYQERRHDLKSIESLRERRFEHWRVSELAAEQSEFDEAARVRFDAGRRAQRRAMK